MAWRWQGDISKFQWQFPLIGIHCHSICLIVSHDGLLPSPPLPSSSSSSSCFLQYPVIDFRFDLGISGGDKLRWWLRFGSSFSFPVSVASEKNLNSSIFLLWLLWWFYFRFLFPRPLWNHFRFFFHFEFQNINLFCCFFFFKLILIFLIICSFLKSLFLVIRMLLLPVASGNVKTDAQRRRALSLTCVSPGHSIKLDSGVEIRFHRNPRHFRLVTSGPPPEADTGNDRNSTQKHLQELSTMEDGTLPVYFRLTSGPLTGSDRNFNPKTFCKRCWWLTRVHFRLFMAGPDREWPEVTGSDRNSNPKTLMVERCGQVPRGWERGVSRSLIGFGAGRGGAGDVIDPGISSNELVLFFNWKL